MTTPNTLLAAARLTPEQKKRVAEVVTGKPFCVEVDRNNGRTYIKHYSHADNNHIIWKPDFNGIDWQRSQALAVVEWLAKRNGCYIWEDVRQYMRNNLVEKLERLVLELSDE